MATNLKFQSPVDPDSIVLVSKDADWKNIKIYAGGSLQYQSEDGAELRSGQRVSVKGLGTLQLQLTTELEVRLENIQYRLVKTDNEDNVNIVSNIFWALLGFSGLGLASAFFPTEDIPRETLRLIIGVELFVMLVFGVTAFLLSKKIYWSYFIGTGVFVLLVIYKLIHFELNIAKLRETIDLVVQLVLMIVVILKLPYILKSMKSIQSENINQKHQILDQQ